MKLLRQALHLGFKGWTIGEIIEINGTPHKIIKVKYESAWDDENYFCAGDGTIGVICVAEAELVEEPTPAS